MEIKCENCDHWVIKRIRVYEDGTEIADFESAPHSGQCDVLNINTAPDFYCPKFVILCGDHIDRTMITGAPWQRFKMIPCPDCKGRGCGEQGGTCGRCMGTSKVREYDDGFIGEEKTRRHPNDPTPEEHAEVQTIVPASPSIPI